MFLGAQNGDTIASNNSVYSRRDPANPGCRTIKAYAKGRGRLAITVMGHIHRALRQAMVQTHFERQIDDRTILVRDLDPCPFFMVVSRVATISFCKRHPGVTLGTRFVKPVVDIFPANDPRSIAQYDPELGLFKVKSWGHAIPPEQDPHYISLYDCDIPERYQNDPEKFNRRLNERSQGAFRALESFFAKDGVMLQEARIDLGFTKEEHAKLCVCGCLDLEAWLVQLDGHLLGTVQPKLDNTAPSHEQYRTVAELATSTAA